MVTRVGPLDPYDVDALVVGAGPTGLVLALELARYGVSCRIIDKAPQASDQSKALMLQARTLEVFRSMQIIDEMIALGHWTKGVNLVIEGRQVANMRLTELDSPYPFALCLAQGETERILGQHLQTLGSRLSGKSP